MKVALNRKACNGCTICNITCPEVFSIHVDGKVELAVQEVPKNVEQVCIEAVDECPMHAISVEYDRSPAFAMR